jgi:hypothetical protein
VARTACVKITTGGFRWRRRLSAIPDQCRPVASECHELECQRTLQKPSRRDEL